jgi:hypothetical protein
MSKATRKANRKARQIIRFTRTEWNGAQEAAWAGGYGSPAVRTMDTVAARRGKMITAALAAGVDGFRLRPALRAAEVKG